MLVLAFCISLSALSSESDTDAEVFQLTYPKLDHLKGNCRPGTEDPCSAEFQLLIQAVANLETAKRNAKDAYEAWYDCVVENGGDPGPAPSPNPNRVNSEKTTTTTFSILERSN